MNYQKALEITENGKKPLLVRSKAGVEYTVPWEAVELAHDPEQPDRHFIYGHRLQPGRYRRHGRRILPGTVKWFYLENMEPLEAPERDSKGRALPR